MVVYSLAILLHSSITFTPPPTNVHPIKTLQELSSFSTSFIGSCRKEKKRKEEPIMEVENQRLISDPLRSKFVTNHQKPYKITKQEHELTIEIKVIYMRIISSTIVLDMQRWSSMNLVFLPRDHHSCLCINSYKINPSEKISRSLNRHRADALMSESIYVNTDRINFKGVSLPFEIQVQDCSSLSSVLVSGVLRKLVNVKDDCMWVMECIKEGGIEGNGDQYFGNGGLVDVYFAGRSLGKPFLLNGLVEYLKRLEGMDGFPNQGGNETISDDNSKDSRDDHDMSTNDELEKKLNNPQLKNEEKLMMLQLEEGEGGGEVSWFNAGVRVGIGLGMGMCLGAGVGLSLALKTYQATSTTFRKFKFM